MERNFLLGVVNIWTKSLGAVAGGMFFVSQFNCDGKPIDMAYLAAYCALGYMAGNIFSAFVSLPLLAQSAVSDASETLSKKENEHVEDR